MKHKSVWLFALLFFALPSIHTHAQERAIAFTGANIIPINGAPISDGVLVVRAGKIVAVGARGAVTIPAGAEVRDVRGKIIMPGLVDTHSHVGGGAGADASAPLQPEVRIMDAVNARDNGLQRAQAGGITSVNVMPGSGHLLSGQTVYLKLRDKTTIDDLMYRDASGNLMYGIKMANGTNPLRQTAPGPFPGTRAKSAALARELFIKAQDYREKIRRAGNDASKLPARDLAMEAMGEVLDRKRIVHFHTHRHDDIMTVLRLQKEFGFRVVLQHVTEGYKVAKEIAAAKIPTSIIVIDAPGGKLETQDLSFANGKILNEAGVNVAFHTDDYITDSRFLLRSAALGVRAGMPRDAALRALTLSGAEMMDLQTRVGSLETGKDADFIILSGDPFSVYTKVLETYVEGTRVFNREDPADRLIATGGYGAGHDQETHIECFDGDHDGGQDQR
ncbi:MAG: amidohydrolase family protein [Pyrinomonadaceae bacterium MAG19_C2-C3]|nr:amidohydrolase family protein [Pyrinomonadaceae bacterium MAG19_C2-C3]